MLRFRVPGVDVWFIIDSSDWSFEKCVSCIPIADWEWVYDGG